MKLPDRLPSLSGNGLTAYRIVWTLIFVLALIGATFGLKELYQRNVDFNEHNYRLGLRMTASDNVRLVGPLFPGANSVVPDSRLLAIDGYALPATPSHDETTAIIRLLGGPEGTVHRLLLRDPQGRESETELTVRQANLDAFDAASGVTMHQRLYLYLGAELATALLFLTASALLFARRAREPVVALLALGLAVQFAQRTAVLTGNGRFVDMLAQFDFTTLLLGLGLAVFPSGRFEPRWTLLVVLGLVATLLADPWVTDSLRLAMSIVVALGVVAANVVRYRRLASTIERQQVKWATLGIGAGIVLITIVNVMAYVQPNLTDSVTMVLVSAATIVLRVLALTCLVGGLLVSLLRYRLYDADAALSRSAAYGSLALALIAVFAGSEKLLELLAEQYWGESVGFASGAVAAGIAAALLPPLHHRLDHWAERRFQGPLLELRTKMPERLGDWRETAEPVALAREALRSITDALHTQGGAIVAIGAAKPILASDGIAAADLKGWLARFDGRVDSDDPLLPVRIPLGPLPDGGSGWLLLAPRPDGTVIGKDECEAVQTIADPLARALAVAMQRRRREARLDGALKKLSARLTRLEAGAA
jgi:hypothetical protein